MDSNNQLIPQVTGDFTGTDYQNISLGITDLESRSLSMNQTGHVIDYTQYPLDPTHQSAMYQNNPNLNMVMMPFPNTQQVMAPLYSRVPIQTEEEQPMYVNAKQYHRILKRRQARAKQDSINPNHRKRGGYLHQSRHNHACKRPRGEGGRFLSKDSANKQQIQSPDQISSPNQTLATLASVIPQQQQQQQQQQQSSSQQQQQQTPPPLQQPTPQQTEQQQQNHKIKSAKHSSSSSSPQSALSSTSPTNDVNISSSNNSSFKREISPQISIISPNSNTGDQRSISINSADDVTSGLSSSSQSQGFQQFQSPFQQLQQQIQIQPSTSDNDSKTEQTVSAASMADGGLPPLDKDILDNWGY